MLKVKLSFTGSCLNQHTEEIHPTVKADLANVLTSSVEESYMCLKTHTLDSCHMAFGQFFLIQSVHLSTTDLVWP